MQGTALVAAALLAAPAAHAQRIAPPATVECTLQNGDHIVGTFTRASRTIVRLHDSVLGRIALRRGSIAHCQSASPDVRASIGGLALAPFDSLVLIGITPRQVEAAPDAPLVLARVALHAAPLQRLRQPPSATPLGARALPAYTSRVGWKRTLGTSYALTRGNANASDLGFTGAVTRRAARSQVALTVRRRFASADGEQSADFFSATLRYDRATGPNDANADRRPSFFSETVYEHDPFAKVIRRTVSNVGFSVPLSRDTTNDLALEIGGGVTHELPEGGARPYTHAGGLLRLAARQRFGSTHADQQFAAFPDLSGPVGHYRLNSDFNIAAPITQRISLKLGVQSRYDTHPQASVRKADTTLQSGIGVEF